MRIHILGICGTFMAGIAQLAKQLGHDVSGCDANIYPPMSDVLYAAGIELIESYDPNFIPENIDSVIMGNAMKRGMPIVEEILNRGIPFISGPQWLSDNVLKNYKVIAVSGTHGKTTTTSLITWFLQHAGRKPGFLIGGASGNFGKSAHLGEGEYFVIEADEYDSAFFDKRPKFMHYHPEIAVLNNLEFDHADIYADLEAIKKQFHYLLRTVRGNGWVVHKQDDLNLIDVIERGCWSNIDNFAVSQKAKWQINMQANNTFLLEHSEQRFDSTSPLIGKFNHENVLAAIAACYHAGVSIEESIGALQSFESVKRRMELIVSHEGIHLYDDFAHHPTAIKLSLSALRQRHQGGRLIAIVLFSSYTMRNGIHQEQLPLSLKVADNIYTISPQFNCDGINSLTICDTELELVEKVISGLRKNDTVVVMNNKASDSLLNSLKQSIINL